MKNQESKVQTYANLKRIIFGLNKQELKPRDYNNKIRLYLYDIIMILYKIEKKNKKQITKQLEHDFISVINKTLIYLTVREVFDPLHVPVKRRSL